MQKRIRAYTPVIVILMALSLGVSFMAFFYNKTLFYYSISLTGAVFVAVVIMLSFINKGSYKILKEIEQGIISSVKGDCSELPVPAMTVYNDSEIVWYNELCAEEVFDGREMRGESVFDVISGVDISEAVPGKGYNIEYGGKLYTTYLSRSLGAGENISVIFLIDDSALKKIATEYKLKKPSIALIAVDNYEEMVQDYKDSERAQLMGSIEQVVETFFQENNSFAIKISRDKFAAFIEQRGLQKMLVERFDILDKVRALHVGDRMSATLSLGVGQDDNSLYEAANMAHQALDMCLGRGGDQAAVKTQNGYEFYGGVSKAVEKRTKVKTRIIAAALEELIESAGNVIIMGHRFGDLDSLGSAVGILKSVKFMGKPAVIVIEREKNLVGPLIDKLLKNGYNKNDFVDPQSAIEYVNPSTLLIIVDTHVPSFLESERIYRACKTVVVIDHHRKLVDHIANAVIFFHEPYASSTSEMVAEMIQYFPKRPQIGKIEAEAMMAGIMLDTKNFVFRTGVRTFEAAAYLRKLGADTVEVRKFFASSMDAYQNKASLVATAQLYHNCAIAVSDMNSEGIQVIAPQAADELMTINGVDASFVIYLMNNTVNISARSMGSINVQVLMEKLGGGGHQTMAAVQFSGGDVEEVRKKLMEVLDECYNNSIEKQKENKSSEKDK